MSNRVAEADIARLIREESVLVDKEGLVSLYEGVLKLAGWGLGGILRNAGKQGGARGAQLLRGRLG